MRTLPILFAILLCTVHAVLTVSESSAIWTTLPPNTYNVSMKGVYFVPTSEEDATPLMLVITGSSDYADTLMWFTWNTSTSQLSPVKQYTIAVDCDIAQSGHSGSYVLPATSSPTQHPLLYLGCTSREPLILDLWTLNLTASPSTFFGSNIESFWYNEHTPGVIWSQSENDVFVWDIDTLDFIAYAGIYVATWESRVINIGEVFLLSAEDNGAFLYQWEASEFLQDGQNSTRPPMFNVSVPDNQVLDPVTTSSDQTTIYAVGRSFPAFQTTNTAYIYTVDSKRAPKQIFSLPLVLQNHVNLAGALPYASVLIAGEKILVVAFDVPLALAALATGGGESLSVEDAELVATPSDYSCEFGGLVAVPAEAQDEFPFDFILQLNLFPKNGGFMVGAQLVPYKLNN